MPIVSCDIPVDLVNRLNTVCLALGFSRNHVLKVLIKEEVEKLEKQMLTPIGVSRSFKQERSEGGLNRL